VIPQHLQKHLYPGSHSSFSPFLVTLPLDLTFSWTCLSTEVGQCSLRLDWHPVNRLDDLQAAQFLEKLLWREEGRFWKEAQMPPAPPCPALPCPALLRDKCTSQIGSCPLSWGLTSPHAAEQRPQLGLSSQWLQDISLGQVNKWFRLCLLLRNF
jgi:hypothetical protein